MKNLLILLIILIFKNCNPSKTTEVFDPTWQEESQKIASEICEKLRECINTQKIETNPKLNNFLLSTLSPTKCLEKNKKSNVYKLKGKDPTQIKQNYRTCKEHILQSNCESIIQEGFQKFPECGWIANLQKL